ncbi:MAG: acylphosphatase [bacterium]
MTIRGNVQGVGYRYYCYRRAAGLGVGGWVKNNPDGSVSVAAEGERSLLEELIKDLKVGPPGAVVTDIDVTWEKLSGSYQGFNITH